MFSENTIFIIDKQIEEADLLIINKIDLLSEAEVPVLKSLINKMLQDKITITQNSFSPQNIDNWLDTLENLPPRKREPLKIDYELYGNGESNLIWLNEEFTFTATKPEAGEYVICFIENVVNDFREKQIPIGHLKFLLLNGEQVQKISFTAIHDGDWAKNISLVASNRVKLMMNARIETTPNIALSIIQDQIATVSTDEAKVSRSNVVASQPIYTTQKCHIQKATHCCEECVCLKKILARNATRREDGSATALAELESEEFECCCNDSDGDGCCC